MSKKPESQQIDFEHDIFLAFHLFFIMGGKITQLFPEQDKSEVPSEPKNPYLDPEQTHPKYVLLMIILIEGIAKHINLLPYLLLPPINLSNVSSIQIKNYRNVYSPLTPIKANYHLKIHNKMLVGDARFLIGGGSIVQMADIIIPRQVVQSFLNLLESAKIQRKPCLAVYILGQQHPWVSISVMTNSGETKIFSISHDNSYIPWCVKIKGHNYILNSDIPMQALTIFEPYLKHHILDKMINENKYR